MNEPTKTRLLVKSRIAVMKGSSLHNKENIPWGANKKKNVKSVQTSHDRKTLAGRKDINSQTKQVVESGKVKSAPNFEKLHEKWESKLAKKKASAKRPNTKIEPFNLTEGTPKKNDNNEDDSTGEFSDSDCEYEISFKRSANEISDNHMRETRDKNCLYREPEEKQALTPKNANEFKDPSLFQKSNLSSVRHQRMQTGQAFLDFKPDNAALQSILNNVGVEEFKTPRPTPNKRNLVSYYSPSPFKQKRTSVYYMGPRPDRPLSGFEQRLIIRRASSMNKNRRNKVYFEPSKTLVGIQETTSRFSVTPRKELPLSMDHNSSPSKAEEASQDDKLSGLETNNSCGETLKEISWADTLKYYTQFPSSNNAQPTPNKSEDTEALIAQLEAEVYQQLSEIKLVDKTTSSQGEQPLKSNFSAPVTNTEFSGDSNFRYPLQGRQENPSRYRQLFSSPFPDALETKETKIDRNAWLANSSGTRSSSENIQKRCCGTDEEEINYKPTNGGNPFCTLQKEPTSEKIGIQPLNSVPFPSLLFKNLPVDTRVTASVPFTKQSLCEKRHISESSSSSQKMHSEKPHVPCIPLNNTPLNEKSNRAFSRQPVNQLSAFTRLYSSDKKTTKISRNTYLKSANTESAIIVPTPQRPPPCKKLPTPCKKLPNHVDLSDTARSRLISRHRQIMRDAIMKSRDHAQEILLDAEVSLYARNIDYLRKYELSQRLENPLAKLFSKGDDTHFVPVHE